MDTKSKSVPMNYEAEEEETNQSLLSLAYQVIDSNDNVDECYQWLKAGDPDKSITELKREWREYMSQ